MLTLTSIRQARERIQGVIHKTPLIFSNTFSRMCGVQVYLKLENFQRAGSFKIRGAVNKIGTLTKREKTLGVITASAGNHAQGVALAARFAGVSATVIIPQVASLAKVEAVNGYGANVILHGDNFDEAQRHALELSGESGAKFIHAFDDEQVMAGQGTIALEVLEQLPDVEAIIVPVGGGGLVAGIAVALKEIKPSVQVLGVQASSAPGVVESLRTGAIRSVNPLSTIADGIAISQPGNLTMPLIKQNVDGLVTVEEEDITQAMVLFLERMKIVVEGAGAVGLAALLSERIRLSGKKVVVLVSGGNVDINLLHKVIQHGLEHAGRYLTLSVFLPDQAGELGKLLGILGMTGANVLEVAHHRQGLHVPLGQVRVEIIAETRGLTHAQEIHAALVAAGYFIAI